MLAVICVSGFVITGCGGDEKTYYHYVDGSGPAPTPTPPTDPIDPTDPTDPTDPVDPDLTGEELFTLYCNTSCHYHEVMRPSHVDPDQFHHDPGTITPYPTRDQLVLIKEYIEGGSEPTDPAEPSEPTDPTEDPITAGQALFNSGCQGCHNGNMFPAAAQLKGATLPSGHYGSASWTEEQISQFYAYINSL